MNRSTAHEYLMGLNSFRNFVLAAYNGKLTVDEIITKIRKGSDLGYHIQPPQLFYMVVVFRILTYVLLYFCFYKCYGLEVLVLTLSTLQISYLDIVVSTN